MEERTMAVKKATVDSTMAKVEAAAKKEAEAKKAPAKKAPAKKAAPAKAEAKKEEVAPAKAEAKKAPAKKETPAKAEAKKAPAKKAPAKKAATTTNVVIEYAGGQVATADIVAKAAEVSGKKSVKTLNVYYQPENGMVYFTADGEEGSFAL